jgi:hypothetical protein
MRATIMIDQQGADRLQRSIAGLVALEDQTAALLERLAGAARAHPEATAALERLHATSRDHRDGLVAHLRELGPLPGSLGNSTEESAASDNNAAAVGPPRDAPVAGGTEPVDTVCTGPVSRSLRLAYLACNDATVGYGALHATAHICDSVRFAATVRLAERHLRRYTRAAQEINQLLAEVVAWELRQQGQVCACRCPACGLGICWCSAHTTDALNAAWRETAPAYPSSGLRVAPNSRRPADLDVREGDVVIAVDGRRVATTADVTAAVLGHAPGEPITFGIDRPGAGAIEITATRR